MQRDGCILQDTSYGLIKVSGDFHSRVRVLSEDDDIDVALQMLNSSDLERYSAWYC